MKCFSKSISDRQSRRNAHKIADHEQRTVPMLDCFQTNALRIRILCTVCMSDLCVDFSFVQPCGIDLIDSDDKV